MEIKKGSIVKYKREFCTQAERGFVFAVEDVDVERNWCQITCLNDGFSIPVSNTLSLNMVEPTGLTVENDVLPFAK